MGFLKKITRPLIKPVQKVVKTLINHHQSSRHHIHQYVDAVIGSPFSIGGKLKNVKVTTLARQNLIVTIDSIDEYLSSLQIPQDKKVQASKLKICKLGTIQVLQFYVGNGEFKGKAVLIKGQRLEESNICISYYADLIQAQFQKPQIQTIRSKSGSSFANRPLNQLQTKALTNAVKNKAQQLQSEWKSQQFCELYQ